MAYEVDKEKDSQSASERGNANPYAALTAPGQTGTISPQAGDAPSKTAPAAPGTLGGSGPSATGYVNFDSLYNANAGVAQREAGKAAAGAEGKAKAAQQGLTGAQGSFNAKLTGGSVAGPSADDYQYATGQKQFYGAGVPQAPATNVAQFRDRSGARTSADPTETDWRAQLQVGAAKKFDGPTALSATDPYLALTEQTAAAQDAINNPTAGMGQTDAALLGAAGRPRFAELQSQYGNLKGDLLKANEASIAQSKAAKGAHGDATDAYERLLSDYEWQQQAAADAAAERNKPIVIGAAPGVGGSQELGWVEGMGQHRKTLGEGMDLEQAKSNGFWGSTNPGGYTDQMITLAQYMRPEGQDADSFQDPSFAAAEALMNAIDEADWGEFQKAVAKGPNAVRQWVAAMQAKYGA